MNKKICLYHKNCFDGLAAAYAIYSGKDGSEYDYHPASYYEKLPDLSKYEEVLMVDFSVPLDDLRSLMKTKKVTVLDHHDKAVKALSNASSYSSYHTHESHLILDVSKSGAVLSWEYVHSTPLPKLFEYIQDRDLWTWKLEHSREVSTYLELVVDLSTCTFEEFGTLVDLAETNIDTMVETGSTLIEYKNQLMTRIINDAVICDFKVNGVTYTGIPIVNSNIFQSEIGNILSKQSEFAAVFSYDMIGDMYKFSLRSNEHSLLNLSELAKLFGGGGHVHAAGFSIPSEKMKDVVISFDHKYL
jgi:uncharacterized protein